MPGKLGLPELIIILVVALLVFGPSKLGDLGKSLGEGIRGFKSALNEGEKTNTNSATEAEEKKTV